MVFVMFGSMREAMVMASTSDGNARKISVMRMMTVSTQVW